MARAVAISFPRLGYHHGTLGHAESGLLRAALWGVPAVLLVAGVVALDRTGLRWPAPLVRVGDWSYSAYLVQPLAIAFLKPVCWPDWQTGWAALVLSVLASCASHRWIEHPATKRPRALLNTRGPGGAPPIRAATARIG